ncbi:MAG: hypothetical protein HY676_02310 [Chloroflexi bacterium]|nr:hypothetical protein [Chloroflexota bacterium]
MILTAEQYSRGFIDFDAVLAKGCVVELWTRTADRPEDDTEWTGPYSTPEGTIVLSPPKPYMQLRVELKRGSDPTKTPILTKVRWERDGKAFIWPGPVGFNGPPGPLSLGRDYGVSYRLAFQPKRAGWAEPFVVIGHRARIRFWKSGIKGYNISGFRDAEPTPEGNFSVGGNIEEVEADGDVVEVLVTVSGNNEEQVKEAAKTQVESTVGLLALCFGEQILGKPIFADYYFSDAKGEQGQIHVPVKHLPELSVGMNFVPFVDEALVRLDESPIGASVGMALRWYVAGLNSESPIDAFIAYFVGLEALSVGYFVGIHPKPIRKEYAQLEKYFGRAQPTVDKRLKDIVLDRLADFPLSMKFERYWRGKFNYETRESKEFPGLNRLRNNLFHGSIRTITSQQVDTAKTLLEKLLAKECGIEKLVNRRQAGPKLLEFALTYATMPSNKRPQP